MTNPFAERYRAAAHALQSVIAAEIAADPERARIYADPKHIRVGIDLSKIEEGALVRLLIGKGVITAEEYAEAITDAVEAEADERGREVAEKYYPGGNVTFH